MLETTANLLLLYVIIKLKKLKSVLPLIARMSYFTNMLFTVFQAIC